MMLVMPAIGEETADDYGLYVGGVKVTPENARDILGDGSATFSPESRWLHLKEANIHKGSLIGIESNVLAAIYSEKDLSISIKGECEVDSFGTSESDSEWVGICCEGDLSIHGDNLKPSKLRVFVRDDTGAAHAHIVSGIKSNGNIEFYNCTVVSGCGQAQESDGGFTQYGVLCKNALKVKLATVIGFTADQTLSKRSAGVQTRTLDLERAVIVGMSGIQGFRFQGILTPSEFETIAYMALFNKVKSGDLYNGSDAKDDNPGFLLMEKSLPKKFVSIVH